MAYKPPVAVYDACVLYPFHLRNILVQCAVDRLVEARWTERIHEEWIRNLVAKTPGLTATRLMTTRDLMNKVLPGANVTGFEHLIQGINLPDPDDRHVVAAGIAANASIVVTWNRKDFPANELGKVGMKAQTPDMLLMSLYAAAPDVTISMTRNARRNLRVSRTSRADFLAELKRQKLNRFATTMAAHIAAI